MSEGRAILTDRVIVYIDWQNTYKGARETFCPRDAFHTEGQVDPVALAELLCRRAPEASPPRTLEKVRVYAGLPASGKDPKGYGAKQRQISAWNKRGALVIAKPLRYPWDYPKSKPEEKGVDVALAIDFVVDAIDGRYDVGIIVSTDTDLRPALEVVATRFRGRPCAETAAWQGEGANRALSVKGAWITRHGLDAADYESVRDKTDFNLGPTNRTIGRAGSSIGNRRIET